MPISDNECDDYDMEYGGHGHDLGDMSDMGDMGDMADMGGVGQPMSKAEQRRSNKPIMEKRRRARINHCLNELKSLILEAMKKDPARHSKLEKADILEMTVKHLQNVQRQQVSQAVTADPHTLHKFKAGFNECATEVSRFVSRMDGVDVAVRQRLVAHLSGCVQGLQQIAPFSFPGLGQGLGQGLGHGLGSGLGLGPGLNASLNQVTSPSVLQQVQLSGDINNNNNAASRVQSLQSLQLIPSRLPTGELALLLPNSGQLSSAGLLFPAASTVAGVPPMVPSAAPAAPPAPSAPADSSNAVSTPVIKTSHHISAFTAVGSLHGLGSVAATPPASETASGSASGSVSSSPDTPPSSARALQLSRVAADSSTPSTPESMQASPCSRGRPSTDFSPSSSSVEVKVEPKTEPSSEALTTPRAPYPRLHPHPRASSALDFSLKRCGSDSSEAETEGDDGAPPCKMARYTLSVMSAPATSTHGTTLARPLPPLQASAPSSSSGPGMHGLGGHPANAALDALDEKGDRDMWRPW